MAHYTTTIRSPWSAEKAFEFIADFRNFAEWDPGVSKSVMTRGEQPGEGTVYAVTVKSATLDYVTQQHVEPSKAVIEGTSKFFYSYDVIEIVSTEDGCDVTYDATLKLRSIAAVANPFLGVFFDKLGDSAADGLAKALEGKKIA